MDSGNVVGSRYKIIRSLAAGFLGEVFLAADIRSNRTYVLKTYYPNEALADYPHYIDRIQHLLSAAEIQNLIVPLDSGIEGGQIWEVSNYIAGAVPLSDYVQEERPNLRHFLGLIAKIATALAGAHARSVIHGDIKPTNILIAPDGEPKIIDFGMVQVGDRQQIRLIATYKYLHPTLRQFAPVKPKSAVTAAEFHGSLGSYLDIYALGVLTLELLTGKEADAQLTSELTVGMMLRAHNGRLSSLDGGAVDKLAVLIHRMLTVTSKVGISASAVAEDAKSLMPHIPEDIPVRDPGRGLTVDVTRPIVLADDMAGAIGRLDKVAKELQEL